MDEEERDGRPTRGQEGIKMNLARWGEKRRYRFGGRKGIQRRKGIGKEGNGGREGLQGGKGSTIIGKGKKKEGHNKQEIEGGGIEKYKQINKHVDNKRSQNLKKNRRLKKEEKEREEKVFVAAN